MTQKFSKNNYANFLAITILQIHMYKEMLRKKSEIILLLFIEQI